MKSSGPQKPQTRPRPGSVGDKALGSSRDSPAGRLRGHVGMSSPLGTPAFLAHCPRAPGGVRRRMAFSRAHPMEDGEAPGRQGWGTVTCWRNRGSLWVGHCHSTVGLQWGRSGGSTSDPDPGPGCPALSSSPEALPRPEAQRRGGTGWAEGPHVSVPRLPPEARCDSKAGRRRLGWQQRGRGLQFCTPPTPASVWGRAAFPP